MVFDNRMLKEISFRIHQEDEELMRVKLAKIGVNKENITSKTMPPSALRKEYIVNVHNENYIKCINCDHFQLSHEVSKMTISDKCFGLNNKGENCRCERFISINGETIK